MTIQLGYVILFSSAFPPAALCALLNNLIEIRSDAFKLAYVCQRPFGQRVPNIGTWQVRLNLIIFVFSRKFTFINKIYFSIVWNTWE